MASFLKLLMLWVMVGSWLSDIALGISKAIDVMDMKIDIIPANVSPSK